MRWVMPVLVTAVLAVTVTRAHAGDPDRVWRTLESDHFVVHYYAPNDDIARRVAVVAERAHRTLSAALDHQPTVKTHVLIVDDVDGANGFASVLPRNQITLFATAPNAGSVLAHHDDWLYGLFAHEYTHILHLDTIAGLPSYYNAIFGKIWAPNQTMPRWIIEGIATYEESKRSSSGRTRSTQFDMYLRVPALENQNLGLDEVSNAPLRFPRGNAAYLYGGHFLRYVFDRFGDDTLRVMSHAGGSATIPFGVNRQLSEAIGRDFDSLYDDWRRHLRDKATLQLEAVERRGTRVGRRLSVIGEVTRNPRYSRDGKELFWLEFDGVRRDAVIRSAARGADRRTARDVRRIDRVGTFDLDGDGAVVYEQNQAFKDVYSYQDLYRWDVKGDRVERLTKGERARDPAVSPDGDRIAFSRNGGSRSEIVVIDRRRPKERLVVWRGGRWDQAYNPAWSPDGTRIAFTAWRTGGMRDVLVVPADRANVGMGPGVVEITHDRALDGDPAFSPDGTWLYFTSDRTGIQNVFARELATGATWQVTNVIGGVTEMAVAPDGASLAYDDFVGTGWDLYEIALDPRRWTPALPYVDDRPPATSIPDDEAVVSAPRPYRALETLAPHSWEGQLAVGQFGRAVTLQTTGNDIAGLHGYTLGSTVELERGDISVGGAYGYSGLRPGLRVAAARSIARRTNFRVDGMAQPWTEEVYSLTAAIGLPPRRNDASAISISLDYDFDWFRRLSTPPLVANPDQTLPVIPTSDVRTAGVALRAAFGNVRGYLYGVGPGEGMEMSGAVRLDHPAIGATARAIVLSWFWRGYWKVPWGESNNVAVRYTGGMRAGDNVRGAGFALGGVPDQDIAQSIIDSSRFSPTGYLRGYPQRAVAGNIFHLANVEYRHQVYSVEKGASTLPVFVKRLHVAGLVDAGAAYDGPFTRDDVRWSVGGAVRLDAFFGFFVPGTFELGYSRGLSQDGIGEGWFLLTTWI
jgi:Tol biopolymer transport system component